MSILDSFVFLFVDKEDLFFSKHLLKLDFQQYYYLLLRQQGYKSVLFFDQNTADSTEVFCVKQESYEQLREKAYDSSGFFGSRHDFEMKKVKDGKPYTFTMKNKDVAASIIKLLEDDNLSYKRFAFVIDIYAFEALFHNEKSNWFDRIDGIIKRPKGSVFIITAPNDYIGEVPCVIDQLFSTKKGCELVTYEHKSTEELYKAIKKTGIKTELWEPFSDEQLENMFERIRLDNLICFNDEKEKQLRDRFLIEVQSGDYRNRRKLYKVISNLGNMK